LACTNAVFFAGPLQRREWLRFACATAPGVRAAEDAYGRRLLQAGISEDQIKAWSADPQVTCGGKKCSLFDLVEDLNSSECTAKLLQVAEQN
jgi:hypothetical protein